ncbi:MAG: putative fatty-acid--CoA ligase [Hydrocarboniphaga sp.]|uniref:class I adenylate-forming enzyme family protein n=1 Tax=Hydrocarboniphaga sp. TaxID=2033016 RepID=UPI0026051CFC|nr:class I adenylate-forming enzyme family protein [Hydrocarboniphaga sp.]MDB5970165.1 putative fatty-acid--CoA ligase [Hydrocarboniphaga sp.]
MNLGRFSDYWARFRADSPALQHKGVVMTWAQLDRAADTVAASLIRLGVMPGDRVGCMLPNSMEWAITLIATLKAGAIIVPLNTRYGEHELRQIAAQVSVKLVVTLPSLIGKLGAEQADLQSDCDEVSLYTVDRPGVPPMRWKQAVASFTGPVLTSVASDDAAALCFTSGSTGLPKGVVLTHQNIQTFALGQITALEWTSDERVLMLAPFAFTGGVISVFMPAYIVGGCIYIEEGLDAERALHLFVTEGITCLAGVPVLFERIAACKGFADADIRKLRTSMIGGAPVPEALLQTWLTKGVLLRQVYGCSEGCGLIAVPNADVARRKPWSCGWPLQSIDLKLCRDDGTACAPNEAGEIQIRGQQVMQGYWQNDDANRSAWNDGWFQTGDMGIVDDEGHLQVVDRKKNMLISGGVNVYPAEVERAMGELLGLSEVLVFGRPDERWGERVVAAVHGPATLDPETLLKESRRLLGDYKAPREIILSPKPLPRTTTGKLPRHDLDALYRSLHDCPRAIAGGK